jgi:hypothetical protein
MPKPRKVKIHQSLLALECARTKFTIDAKTAHYLIAQVVIWIFAAWFTLLDYKITENKKGQSND